MKGVGHSPKKCRGFFFGVRRKDWERIKNFPMERVDNTKRKYKLKLNRLKFQNGFRVHLFFMSLKK
ncbi:MAG: hypothetical protein CM15mP88_3130 [Pseudomonadota bacterium]|nr:MAG: hypothetical protein CM15mP88_3130 [Pseudomonadota bacterium]